MIKNKNIPKILKGNDSEALIKKLTTMNDGGNGSPAKTRRRRTFKEIANWIEKNL